MARAGIRRATVDIDVAAFEAARDAMGTRGYSDTINRALREVERMAALRAGAQRLREGGFDVATPHELEQLRNPRA